MPLVIKTLLAAYILPVSQPTENIVYKTYITLFSVLSTPEIAEITTARLEGQTYKYGFNSDVLKYYTQDS